MAWFHLASKPLITACRARLFTFVARGINTVQDLASATDMSLHAAQYLLESMVSLQLLLVDQGGHYSNTALASTYLDADRSDYLGDAIANFGIDHIPVPTQTPRSSEPARANAQFDDMHLRVRETEMINGTAIHGLSSGSSMAFGRFYDFGHHTHLLDIAGGIGGTAIWAALANPHLTITLLDSSTICAVGRTYLETLGLVDRVQFLEGQMFTTEYPREPDIHFCSNSLHGFSQEHCNMVIRKSFAALPAGGVLVLHDRVVEHFSPPYSPLLNAGILLLDRHGLVHSVEDYKRWMTEAGFADVEVIQVAGIPGFVQGAKSS